MDVHDRYCPRYCEENVWQLCGDLPADVLEARAVLISNPRRQVAVFCQCASWSPEHAMIWDYHVILLTRSPAGWQAWDADSTLRSPSPAAHYLRQAFRELPDAEARYRPLFRVIDAAEYRAVLRTDRSHMRRADGRWFSPPPPWPCIGRGSNLMALIDMEREGPGRVCDLAGLLATLEGQ